MAETLPISETFTSIQGEGLRAGIPSHFIRVSGCNLRCGWCDTPYASWSPDGGPVALSLLAQRALASGVRDVVLTGGEPMMFDAVEPLSRALREQGHYITVETAGTIARPAAKLACDLLSLSPKLSSSTPSTTDPRDPDGAWRARHEARRLHLPTLQALLDEFPVHQLKFVLASPGELAEVDALLAGLRGWSPDTVLLMPEGVTAPQPGQHDWLLSACTARGFRYCPRLHILLFGNTRGT
ncbi:MAG: 7-carboxy-7-deazaguanine synthase QueE [Phycisphaerales bacterium]